MFDVDLATYGKKPPIRRIWEAIPHGPGICISSLKILAWKNATSAEFRRAVEILRDWGFVYVSLEKGAGRPAIVVSRRGQMFKPAIFNMSSPKHGLSLDEFSHLLDRDRLLLYGLMARISEKSYRRGFQQGWDSRDRGDKVCDLAKWRFFVGLDVSVSPHDTYHCSVESRLSTDCPLGDVGFCLPATGSLTSEMIVSHLAPLFARHRRGDGIKKSTRFAILRRDGFRCVYCGATANDQKLHVDHIHPKSKGGTDDPSNLATSCEACNLGKSNRHIGISLNTNGGA